MVYVIDILLDYINKVIKFHQIVVILVGINYVPLFADLFFKVLGLKTCLNTSRIVSHMHDPFFMFNDLR